MKSFLIFFVFPALGFSQVVTSSFDPASVSFNPAATSYRFMGGVFLRGDKMVMETEGTETGDIPDQNLTNLNTYWKVEDDVNSFKGLVASSGGKLAAELLTVKQTVTTTWERTDLDGVDPRSTIERSTDINTAHLNLSMNLLKILSLGVHAAKSAGDQDHKMDITIDGGGLQETLDVDIDMTGYGAGATLRLPMNFYVAASYAEYELDQDETGSNTNPMGTQAINQKRNLKFKMHTYGIAYMVGKKKGSAFKIELSERYNTTPVSRYSSGSRRTLSTEFIGKTFYGGLAVMQTKEDSVNFQDIVSALISERASTKETKTSFSGNLGLRSKRGHSFGVSASYSKETVNSQISFVNRNNLFPAEQKTVSLSANYAYIFK